MNSHKTFDPVVAAADRHNDAAAISYQSAINSLPSAWLDRDLVTAALEGVELDAGQARSVAFLRDLANTCDHPALLQSAILKFCKSFDELIADHVCETGVEV